MPSRTSSATAEFEVAAAACNMPVLLNGQLTPSKLLLFELLVYTVYRVYSVNEREQRRATENRAERLAPRMPQGGPSHGHGGHGAWDAPEPESLATLRLTVSESQEFRACVYHMRVGVVRLRPDESSNAGVAVARSPAPNAS